MSSPHLARITHGLAARHAAERRFRAYGVAALSFAIIMLAVLLLALLGPGLSGFMRHELKLTIFPPHEANTADYYAITQQSLRDTVANYPDDKVSRHQLYQLVGFFAADDVKRQLSTATSGFWGWVEKHPQVSAMQAPIEVWLPLADNADRFLKGRIDRHAPAAERSLGDAQIAVLDQWQREGRIRNSFNRDFFTRGDSRAPEAAGFMGSIIGSLLVLAVCMGVALPISIMAAITLEEFARRTRFAAMLEIVINNLAAVPSIIYGLLGLSIFLKTLELPRSSALVGGLTLAMLILPVMIIAARASIRAVPPSMRQAAAALGATPLQVVRHHVLPYALPGIMTGTILSVCRALGESAPLLMIGMVAFIADVPRGPLDPATAMPVEIYIWASSPELGFVEKTSTGILVLLVMLLLLNITAIIIRTKSQKTWS